MTDRVDIGETKFKRKLNGIARRKFVAFAFARDLSPLKINI